MLVETDEDEEKTWIEIEPVAEDGLPVAGEYYRITLPDGKTIAQGMIGLDGAEIMSGIDQRTCKITFPNLDKDGWEKA